MKKLLEKLFLLALSVILVVSVSACGSMDNNSDSYVSSNDSKTPLESELSPSQNDNSKHDNSMTEPSQKPSASQNGSSLSDETAKISKEEAKKIALKDAGLTESEIRDFEIELDRDNGVLKYEISFEKGNDDYDYDIDADSGKILKKEKDTDQ